MNKILVIALLFTFCIFSSFANEAAVLDLNKSNFQETVQSNDFVLAMFYAPWCGHCKTLKPQFEEAAQKVAGKYVLAKIDCTVDQDLCTEFSVRGYPTIFFFKNGNKKEYDGPRTADGIISWLDKKSGPTAVELTSAESIQEFSKTPSNVVGFFSNKESAGYKAFIAAAEDAKTADLKFGIVSSSSLFGSHSDESVVVITKQGETAVPSDQDDTAETLATFLFESTFPVIQEVDGSNFKNYVSRGKKLLLAWVKTKADTSAAQIEVVSKLASQYPQFSFGYISHEGFGPNMERMGASGKVIPAITLLSFTENKPIAFEGEWTEATIKEWIDGVISGKIKYQSKSEPLPENNNGPVTVLVGKNFDEIVHDTTKDVLVEYYAPWCGHCKSLAPEYDLLGEAFQKVDDVVIAKIDLTANDVDTTHFEVKGFPTILLYKRDAKDKPLQFQGTRDAKSIGAWVKENTHSEAAKTVDLAKDEL